MTSDPFNEWDIPLCLKTDKSKEEIQVEWGMVCRRLKFPPKSFETHIARENPTEAEIIIHKKWLSYIKKRYRLLEEVCNLLSQYVADIQLCVVKDDDT